MMIGTMDDPSQIDVNTHMFADESFHWVSAHDDDVVYAKHRMNEDGSAAEPLWEMKFVFITVLFLLVILALSFIVTQLLAVYERRKRPAEGWFTEVNGGKIHWTEQGEGETIILIHGLGGNHHNFNYMV